MSDLSSFVTGLSGSINDYLQAGQKQQRDQQNQQFQAGLDVQKYAAQKQIDQSSEGQVTPDMAESMIPGASKWVNSFQQQNQRLPTINEVKTGLDSVYEKLEAISSKNANAVDKESQNQDKLEKQAQDRLVQVRGDQSLMRAESQRDASGLAYDTIAKAQSEGRDLSQVEYSDLLGQLWKARTGSAPTNEVMRDLDQRTAKEGFNRVATYVTGNPNLVGATTEETLGNLKQFVMSTGAKADQQWGSYMKPRLIKPTDLNQDRWDHIVSQQRGISFADQQSVSDKTYPIKPKSQSQTTSSTGWKVIR